MLQWPHCSLGINHNDITSVTNYSVCIVRVCASFCWVNFYGGERNPVLIGTWLSTHILGSSILFLWTRVLTWVSCFTSLSMTTLGPWRASFVQSCPQKPIWKYIISISDNLGQTWVSWWKRWPHFRSYVLNSRLMHDHIKKEEVSLHSELPWSFLLLYWNVYSGIKACMFYCE